MRAQRDAVNTSIVRVQVIQIGHLDNTPCTLYTTYQIHTVQSDRVLYVPVPAKAKDVIDKFTKSQSQQKAEQITDRFSATFP